MIARLALALACLPLCGADFAIPADYLREVEPPPFWVGDVDGVARFLETRVRKGKVTRIGVSAGGRPILAVSYGTPRLGKGTSTYSGSLGFGDIRAFLGPQAAKKVHVAMAGVHGGEFEGIVGLVNLISVLESGKDLRGKPWPAIAEAAAAIDRIVIVPVANPDGRARVPVRMLAHRGEDHTVQEYFNTGGRRDGKLIGWPQCKEHIPLDFSTTQFPGGYPNDAGVNIQHDDFLSPRRQPETEAVLRLASEERPDLMLNMHTGASFIQPLRTFMAPAMMPHFDAFYRRVRGRLAREGLQSSDDPAAAGDPARERVMVYNLDTALHLVSGTLAILVESPAHGFSRSKRTGAPFRHTPEDLLNAQLLTHEEALGFLRESNGLAGWNPARR
ncbi:MAG: hypothetical protein IPM24_25350 [Bryobacterales bacterium]|nr:hypothetical protein [Bryobacterales bacterium]